MRRSPSFMSPYGAPVSPLFNIPPPRVGNIKSEPMSAGGSACVAKTPVAFSVLQGALGQRRAGTLQF